MISQDQKKMIAKLPDTPGVYFFRHKSGSILYIGKATSLRDRVRSYFSNDIGVTRGPKIVKMLEEFETIDFQQTDSVLEALLLESFLIKKHQPRYNTDEKDDKSFYYVVITKEDFPRVLLARAHDMLVASLEGKSEEKLGYKIGYSFGPFPNSGQLKEALMLIRKIFPYRDKCIPNYPNKIESTNKKPSPKFNLGLATGGSTSPKPCFNRQIGLCPGVCSGEVSKAEYHQTILSIVHFFRGEKKLIIKDLEKQMKVLAKAREFEKAGEIKRQIFALNHIHDISLIKSDPAKDYKLSTNNFRIEAYDVAHFAGKDVVGVMTVVENGTAQKAEYRKFKIKEDPGVNDTKALREILRRRLGHDEWHLPNLIVVDGAVAQKNAAEAVLFEFGYEIPVVAVTKNEYHKPKNILGDRLHLSHESEILLANNEAHRYAIGYHKKLRGKL